MNIFTLLTPITYWLLVVLWLFVIIFYFRRLFSKRIINPLTRLLLVILAIDAFRTLFESCYFGAWYTSLAGFIPIKIHDILVRPELVIIPKLTNVFAVVLVIFILLRRWLPQEEYEKAQLHALVQEQVFELNEINNKLRIELYERKQAEQAVTLREQEYHALLENIPDLIVRYDRSLRRTYVNPAWEQASGLSAREVVHVPTAEIPKVPKPIRTEYVQKLQRVLETGNSESIGFFWENAYGTELYLEYVIVPEHDRNGEITGVLAVGRDLSERRRAEEALNRLNRELHAISNCNQTLMKAEDEQTLLDEICRIVCEEAGYRLAWVGYAENDEAKTIRPVAWGGVEEGYLAEARITWADTERGRGPAGTSIRSGKSSCIQDFATTPHAAPWRENALQRGYRSALSLPLKTGKAETFGALIIYSTEPNAFTPNETRLLDELAGDLAFGIQALRNRSELKRSEEVAKARLRMLETAYETDITLDDTLRRMLDEIEAQTGSCIGFYHFLENDQLTLSRQSWSTTTLATMCTAKGKGFHRQVEKAGVWADCVRERQPIIHNDYASLPNRRGMPPGHAPVIRELVVPLMRGPRMVAIVGVGNKPAEYNETDVRVVSLLADFSWEIVTRRQAEEEIRKLNQELEQRVAERTAELESRSGELQDSQRALMNIVEDLNEKTAELEEANTKLKEIDRLKSMFIASMSHELRTPLNSIIGFSSILLNEWTGSLNPEQKQNITAVLRSGKHLLSLINDVIDVSKIEAGKIDSIVEEFDVYEVVLEAVETLKKDIEKKGLELTVHACRHVLHTDRRRLLQCLLNLLSNAIKFTIKGSVGVSAELSSDELIMTIAVEDTGIGIREKDLGNLFSPFVRFHTTGESVIPGTGLGLYLTQRLLKEILKGDILVTSTYGVGSRFTLCVPTDV
jgi:PAS domain S-box-containing protein